MQMPFINDNNARKCTITSTYLRTHLCACMKTRTQCRIFYESVPSYTHSLIYYTHISWKYHIYVKLSVLTTSAKQLHSLVPGYRHVWTFMYKIVFAQLLHHSWILPNEER